MERKSGAGPSGEQLSLDLYPVECAAQERPGPRETRDPAPPRSTAASTAGASGTAVGADVPSLLTTREAAEMLHVHPRTVQRLVERGDLAAVHLGSAVRFDRSDVGSLIARLKCRLTGSEIHLADSVRARNGGRVSFSDRLRSKQHEHRAAHA